MTKIINLRRARKTAARNAADVAAETRRLAFGRTKSERQATQSENARALRHIDGHLRSPQSQQQDPESRAEAGGPDPSHNGDD